MDHQSFKLPTWIMIMVFNQPAGRDRHAELVQGYILCNRMQNIIQGSSVFDRLFDLGKSVGVSKLHTCMSIWKTGNTDYWKQIWMKFICLGVLNSTGYRWHMGKYKLDREWGSYDTHDCMNVFIPFCLLLRHERDALPYHHIGDRHHRQALQWSYS